MAILDRENFMSRLQARIGEDTSDDAISFMEDMTDTFNDLSSRSNGESQAEWQNKYDELDKTWREKYTARFFNTESTPAGAINDQIEDVKDDANISKSFEDLFEEREG